MVKVAERLGDRLLSLVLPEVKAEAIICVRVYCGTYNRLVMQKCCCVYSDGTRSCGFCSYGPHCST